MLKSSTDAFLKISGVPSVDPPSGLIRTQRSRWKYLVRPTWMARTTRSMVSRLLNVGTPTRISTSPTAVSCRSSSSEMAEVSAKLTLPQWRIRPRRRPRGRSKTPHPKPVKLVRAQGEQVGQIPDGREEVSAEHLDRDRPLPWPQI